MSRRRKVLVVIACALVACVMTTMLMREKEPSYGGKRLSECVSAYSDWVVRGMARNDLTAATVAIPHIGTNAVPWLLKWMDYEPPTWKSKAESIRETLPTWLKQRTKVLTRNSTAERAVGASFAFAALGAAGTSGVPELILRIESPSSGFKRQNSILAVSNLGSLARPAVPALVKAFSDPNKYTREMATNAIRRIAPEVLTNSVAR